MPQKITKREKGQGFTKDRHQEEGTLVIKKKLPQNFFKET